MKLNDEKIKSALLILLSWIFALCMLFILLAKLKLFGHIHI